MKKYRKNLVMLLVAVMGLLAAGCGGAKIPEAAKEDQRQALEQASSLMFTGNLEDITLSSDLMADGIVAGSIKETGFLNSKWTVTAGGEPWFYLADPKDDSIYDLEGVIAGNTYGYYDMNGDCLGYAQERVMETDGLKHDWYMVFLDAEGNIRADYLTDEKCNYIMDFDGNELGTGSTKSELFSDNYEVNVETNKDVQIDFMDRVAIGLRLYYQYQSDH